MSVKLSRYVFRKIGGRIVPIRREALASTLEKGISGVSKSSLKKLNTLLTSSKFKLTRGGNIMVRPERSGTDAMNLFMKKTGAVRVSISGDTLNLDPETTLSSAQKLAIGKMARGKEIFTHNSSSWNFTQAINDSQKGKSIFKPSKLGSKIEEKAAARYGEAYSDEMTGYVLRDGRKLSFTYGYGMRDIDHRDVADLVPYNLRKPKKGEIVKELADINRFNKRQRAKKHDHWRLINNIKELKKADFVTGEDRGYLIKDNIRYIPQNKRHLLKKLKKIRTKK